MSRPITTVADLVHALGGTTKAARWAGVRPASISQWLRRGFIPPGWHLRLLIELRRRDFEVDPNLFELTEDEATILRERRLRLSRASRKGQQTTAGASR